MNKQKLQYKLYWQITNFSRSNIIARAVIDILALALYKVFRSDKYFTFQGKRYRYFYHLYNRTVSGERVVEIPIAKRDLG